MTENTNPTPLISSDTFMGDYVSYLNHFATGKSVVGLDLIDNDKNWMIRFSDGSELLVTKPQGGDTPLLMGYGPDGTINTAWVRP